LPAGAVEVPSGSGVLISEAGAAGEAGVAGGSDFRDLQPATNNGKNHITTTFRRRNAIPLFKMKK
jgi:hypothetical protein